MDYAQTEDINEEQEVPEEEARVAPKRPASKYGGPALPAIAKQAQRVVAPVSKLAATPVAKLRAKPLLQQTNDGGKLLYWGGEDNWEGDAGWAEDDSVQHGASGDSLGDANADEEWLQPMPKHRSSAVPDASAAIAPAMPKGSWSSSSSPSLGAKAPLRLRRPDELSERPVNGTGLLEPPAKRHGNSSGTLEPPAKRPKTGAVAVEWIAPPQPKTATAKALPQASAGKMLQLVTNPKASAAVKAYLRNPAVSLPVPKVASSRGALLPRDWQGDASAGESPWAENGEDEYWPEDSGTYNYAAAIEAAAPSKAQPPQNQHWQSR